MVSGVIWNMPEQCVDHFDKLLVKSMDFCEFLTILTERPENRKSLKRYKSDQK